MMRMLTVFFAVAVSFTITNALAQDVAATRDAAEQGIAEAQNELGSIYEDGRGVPQDYSQSLYWYRKAAEQGYATAQFKLAYMYEYGRGVSQDYSQALFWYRKAAEQGNEFARNKEFAKNKIAELAQKIGEPAPKIAEPAQKIPEPAQFNPDTKRDSNDVVAQVLNYSDFGNDAGYDVGGQTLYWYQDKSDKCRYKLYAKNPINDPRMTIDLNALDPRNITFQQNYTGRVIIRHDTDDLFQSLGQLNLERLQRGWSLIYSKYCKGKEKAF
jgi:hypothetical protein